ncbi:translation initiation factor if-3 [Nannochloropsis oceanica]
MQPSSSSSGSRCLLALCLTLCLIAMVSAFLTAPTLPSRLSSASSTTSSIRTYSTRPPFPRPPGGGGGPGRPPFRPGGPPRPGGGGGQRNRWGPPEVDPDRPPMNDALLRLAPNNVRVVISNPEEGDEMAGVMATKEALMKAKEMGLDLIMISETADPPVVKIIDYGKFKYSLEKKKKEQKKKAKTTEVKEVKMSYKIETHDYGVRMKQMTRFLEEGDKVKVMVQFRGREQQHIDLGHELLGKIKVDFVELAVQEGDVRREGGRLIAMFKPKKTI